MPADGGPGKVVSEEVAGEIQGLHEDMTTLSVLGFKISHIGEHRRNNPESLLEIKDGEAPLAPKVAIKFVEDGLHHEHYGLGQGCCQPCPV